MDSGDSSENPAPASDVKRSAARKKKGAPKEDVQLSKVLRSVYQTAVKEDIPDEMLELLRKLD